MATIRITDLLLRTYIGINSWEQDTEQDVLINIAMTYDASLAVRSDDIKDTIDYKALKLDIMKLLKEERFQLLESLTARILDLVLSHPLGQSASVRVDKPGALRFAKSVSVEMFRSKDKS